MLNPEGKLIFEYVLVPWGRDAVALAFDPEVFPQIGRIYLPGREQRNFLKTADKAMKIPPAAELVRAYLAGERVRFAATELDLREFTPFRRAVSLAAIRIPYGQTRSYGELAAVARTPRAARAVGRVMATNPLPLVIPCHRVVAADGGLHGFGGGLPMKARLLELEGVRLASGRRALL